MLVYITRQAYHAKNESCDVALIPCTRSLLSATKMAGGGRRRPTAPKLQNVALPLHNINSCCQPETTSEASASAGAVLHVVSDIPCVTRSARECAPRVVSRVCGRSACSKLKKSHVSHSRLNLWLRYGPRCPVASSQSAVLTSRSSPGLHSAATKYVMPFLHHFAANL